MAFKIGELARAAGVNIQTVRYYERRGLLAVPPRTRSGYRQYGSGALDRIRFVRRAQELGFTLGEIAELLALRAKHARACVDVEARARARLAEVEAKLRQLERMRSVLRDLAESCARRQPTGECPILAMLEDSHSEPAERPAEGWFPAAGGRG